MEDWKAGGKTMGNDIRPYDPQPPPPKPVDINDFPLKLAQLSVDRSLKGLRKYKVELPNAVRASHIEDPVNGGAWRGLILDFDKKLPGCMPSMLLFS